MSAPVWIDLDGVVNMRDLGGLPTRDGGRTTAGRLLRSDNLQDLSPADVRHLAEVVGVSDVVDLRSEAERAHTGPGPLARTHLIHHHHSVFREEHRAVDARSALALPWERRERREYRDSDFWTRHYLGYLSGRPDSVSAALRVVAHSTGGTLVHCAAGKDRTGTLVAMALSVAGVPDEEIVADYVATATRIERIIERLMSVEAYATSLTGRSLQEQTPRPETMRAILAALAEEHGGAEGWLRDQGWSEEDVARLRRRLTD